MSDNKQKFIPLPLILVLVILVVFFLWQFLQITPGEKIVILHTNDLQGQLMPIKDNPNEDIGGFARIATLVKQQREKNKNVILVDGGDTIQGTLFTKLHGGKDFGALMSDLGYDAVTIGEHDFDKGPAGLAEYIKSATYPFVVANIDTEGSKNLDGLFTPYVVLEKNGINIGIFGLLTPEANIFAKVGKHVKVTDPTNAAIKAVSELKDKADIVVALSHLGFTEDKKLAEAVSGIDLIIGAHSKTKIVTPVKVNTPNGGKTYIVQAKNQGRFLGKVDLIVSNDELKSIKYKLLPVDSSVAMDEAYESRILAMNKDLEEKANAVIGETTHSLDGLKSHVRTGETTLGDLFVDAIAAKFPEADVVLLNSGSIRGDEIFPAGKITMADVWEWHPFENKVILVDLTGQQIKQLLERGAAHLPISKGNFLQVSGISFTIDMTEEAQELTDNKDAIKFQGNRIKNIYIAGKPLEFNKYYRVAVNDFIYAAGDGFVTLNQAANVTKTNESLSDVVAEYVKNNSPLKMTTSDRITIKGGLLK